MLIVLHYIACIWAVLCYGTALLCELVLVVATGIDGGMMAIK
jgi:hypothetical protein